MHPPRPPPSHRRSGTFESLLLHSETTELGANSYIFQPPRGHQSFIKILLQLLFESEGSV